MLAALGVKRRSRIYLTTAEVLGGADRLVPLRGLYPFFVTKEQLASPEELAPFASAPAKVGCSSNKCRPFRPFSFSPPAFIRVRFP